MSIGGLFGRLMGGASVPTIEHAEMAQVVASGDCCIIDVREPHEYRIANLNGYLIPLNDLPKRVNELDSAKDIVVYCHTGRRSGRAVDFLREVGFRRVKNLKGGIDEWAAKIDPSLPRY